VIALHGILALMAYRLFVRPLNGLAEATRAIAAGRLDFDLPTGRTDEFGRLAESFQQMSYAVRQMQDSARAANPLSGLPGNVEIEKHVRERMKSSEGFCVLYCDLDNFKAYNDIYGFARGDEIILYTRDCIVTASQVATSHKCFLGHEGGDDYVAVCDYADWERFAGTVVALFDQGIRQFYNQVDQDRGYIEARDRQGRLRRYPMMSVSIAVVTNNHREFHNFGEIVKVAAEMKAVVKGKPGSAYAIDRRRE
jgi:diguanylate cyclase (GGDEF)-like protein